MGVLGQRFLAILGGIVTVFVLSAVTDMVVMHTIAPELGRGQATTGVWLGVTTYRCAYSAVGAFLTAMIAPDHPLAHAVVLGLIGLALGLVGAFAVHAPGPAWYPVAVAVQALPFAWIGGKLATQS